MTPIHDAVALEAVRKRLRIEPWDLKRLRNAFYKKHQTAEESLEHLSVEQRDAFRSDVAFHSLRLHSRRDSEIDGATKLLFRTVGGHLIESVILRIASGRTSLCVSSQVGCAVRCRFCATGQMGTALDLTSEQILDQVVQANHLLRGEGRSIRNVVFMGMGEPLLNESAVYAALDVLLSPQCFDLSPAKVLVSTVGIPDAMVRCAERFPRLRMALSLHSARQAGRESLIPLARRYPLESLRRAMMQMTNIQRQPLMVEYLLLQGLNDGDQDMAELINCLRGIPVHFNLIPYNAIAADAGLIGSGAERRRQFADALSEAGFPVTIRYSLGNDIAAACGQLALREKTPS